MTRAGPEASRPADRTGVRCPGQSAPSAREMTIGQGFPSPNQLHKVRIATYRTGLGPGSCWDALDTTIVGNRGEPSGESRFISLRGGMRESVPARGRETQSKGRTSMLKQACAAVAALALAGVMGDGPGYASVPLSGALDICHFDNNTGPTVGKVIRVYGTRPGLRCGGLGEGALAAHLCNHRDRPDLPDDYICAQQPEDDKDCPASAGPWIIASCD